MHHNFGHVAAMTAGNASIDTKVAADSAVVAGSVGKLPWTAFGEVADKGDTRAKPDIWKESAKFKVYASEMQAEMPELVIAAKTRLTVSSFSQQLLNQAMEFR